MQDAKSVTSPLAAHFKLSEAQYPIIDSEHAEISLIPYESAVGSLMYLMVSTRLDIAYAVGKVSRYMANLRKVHWEAVKWILRYIKGMIDYGILFDSHISDSTQIVGYVDADYA